jgi:hypothetical protein
MVTSILSNLKDLSYTFIASTGQLRSSRGTERVLREDLEYRLVLDASHSYEIHCHEHSRSFYS